MKFAIIGCGEIAKVHAATISKLGELIAVCDVDLMKAKAFAEPYQTTAYNTIDELLENEKDITIVSVCSPNGFHAEHCIKSLQAGKHVLCETPFCITGAAAWQMIETAKFSRGKLWLAKPGFNSELLATKEKINSSSVQSFQVILSRKTNSSSDWRNNIFPGGNALLSYFHKEIDSIINLLGPIDYAKTIMAPNKDHSRVEEKGVSIVQMKSGLCGTVNWMIDSEAADTNSLTLVTKEGKWAVDELLNSSTDYTSIYQNIIKEVSDNISPETDTSIVTAVESIEKIFRSVTPQIAEAS